MALAGATTVDAGDATTDGPTAVGDPSAAVDNLLLAADVQPMLAAGAAS